MAKDLRISVEIEGVSASGKTTVLMLFYKTLLEAGFTNLTIKGVDEHPVALAGKTSPEYLAQLRQLTPELFDRPIELIEKYRRISAQDRENDHANRATR